MMYNILLVDDLKIIYHAIANTLTPRGCTITYCDNGKDGYEKAQEVVFDLIILDIHLPDGNGLDICKELKQLPAYKHRPILLLTSDTRNLERGLMVGASDYILKPFKDVEMIARVFTQLNLSKAQLCSSEELKKLKHNLNDQYTALEELQNDLHLYFYQTAHKLRAPLSSIDGLFHLLKIENPSVADNEYVKLIADTVESLGYVNQQIAKIGDIKTHRPKEERIVLKNCISNLMKESYPFVDIKIDPDMLLYADRMIFNYGISPIIDNALFYTQLSDEKTPEITISTEQDGDSTYLIIEDNGPGIDKEKLQKIFDVFFIGHEESGGNGMGLFISKIALSRLSMSVNIYSEPSRYTKVVVDISSAVKNTSKLDSLKKESA